MPTLDLKTFVLKIKKKTNHLLRKAEEEYFT